MAPPTHTGRLFLWVTGASGGFGREIAVAAAETFGGKDSTALLTARNLDGLRQTAGMVTTQTGTKAVAYPLDMSEATADSFRGILNQVLEDMKSEPGSYESALLVQNAGTLGDVTSRLSQANDVDEISNYLRVNVASVAALNSIFLEVFRGISAKTTIVNLSSLCALQPTKGMGLYCTGKAARDMLFQVLAEEEKDVRVLNYAPGPLEGDMQATLRSKIYDGDMRSSFQVLHDEGRLVKMKYSAENLMIILSKDEFVSGQHVDFFD